MNTTLAILLAVAAIWLTAGFVADGLPDIATARGLRRRTGALIWLTATGLAAMAAVTLLAAVTVWPRADDAVRALALPAVPAAAVAGATLRRLLHVRSGAAAFATVPDIPASPALRAGAAHPMVALPLQLAGLVTLPAAVTATGLVQLTGTATWGPVLTLSGLTGLAIGVRHALRHSRLAEHAISVRPRSPGVVDVLNV